MKQAFPQDYLERLYAGILGKVIGVYLGHATEGLKNQEIKEKYGEVWHYVKEGDVVESDDDITGTFLFPRAIEDYPFGLDDLSMNVAKVWLNSLVEQESAIAWGGKGISTEHTVYCNLKQGIMPPHSGSIATNGSILAQQVGGQIFIEMWGLIAPNDPDLAYELVTAAVKVSHDGEALYAAQVLATIIAMSFSEKDIKTKINKALEYIPKDSNIYKIDKSLLELFETTKDYEQAYQFIEKNHSYAHYKGKWPTESNHATVIFALLYGENSFAKSLMIVDTCGLDTDGNSANVAAIVGVTMGVVEINKDADYILPMRGLVYVPYAEGGEAITDCENLAYRGYNIACKIKGIEPLEKKQRFAFSLPYSLHGFELIHNHTTCPQAYFEDTSARNIDEINGLEINFKMITKTRAIQAETLTLERYDKRDLPWYKLTASPTLYSGQKIEMSVSSPLPGLEAALYVGMNSIDDSYILEQSAYQAIDKTPTVITFVVPDSKGRPIGKMGFRIRHSQSQTFAGGKVNIHSINWDDKVKHSLIPQDMAIKRERWWNFCWVGNINLTDNVRYYHHNLRLAADKETVILSQGTRDFKNYTALASINSYAFKRGGIGVRCRGLNRYIALMFTDNNIIQLVAKYDFEEIIIAQADYSFNFDGVFFEVKLQVIDDSITANIGNITIKGKNPFPILESGGACLIVEDGSIVAEKFDILSI